MIGQFHIKEDLTPGKCEASIKSCPRGENGHGTEAEMIKVSEKLFAEQYEVVVSLRKKDRPSDSGDQNSPEAIGDRKNRAMDKQAQDRGAANYEEFKKMTAGQSFEKPDGSIVAATREKSEDSGAPATTVTNKGLSETVNDRKNRARDQQAQEHGAANYEEFKKMTAGQSFERPDGSIVAATQQETETERPKNAGKLRDRPAGSTPMDRQAQDKYNVESFAELKKMTSGQPYKRGDGTLMPAVPRRGN